MVMLEEYKQSYVDCANLIPEWKQMSKNELANLYIETEGEQISNSYFSALVCKFWNLIGHYYHKQGVKVASELDCYDWVIDGITEALKDRVWKDERNKLFNDSKGPEKAIVVNIMSIRANFYQYTKYDKRKLNYTAYSLDEIEESCSDGYITPYYDKHDDLFDYMKGEIKSYFSKQDYFAGFFLDALYSYELLFDMGDEVSIKKFNKYIDSIDDTRVENFSNTYDIRKEEVTAALWGLKMIPAYKIHSEINRVMSALKNDEHLYSILGE